MGGSRVGLHGRNQAVSSWKDPRWVIMVDPGWVIMGGSKVVSKG